MRKDIIIKSAEQRILMQERLIEKIKKSEEQIKNGQVIDADIVIAELKEKYGV